MGDGDPGALELLPGLRIAVEVRVFLTVALADRDTLVAAWADDAEYFKQQPGFISAQLHGGIEPRVPELRGVGIGRSVQNSVRTSGIPESAGAVFALVHRNPGHSWTVASLGDEVAMSRSAFAARFTELVGKPAMHYLPRWRMHIALTWLKEEDAPLGEMARRLGYESEAAFSRAFKRFIGFPPAAVRRSAATPTRHRHAARSLKDTLR